MPKSTSERRDSQKERFIRTARELECAEDPAAFERAVRKLVKAPPAPRQRPKKDASKAG